MLIQILFVASFASEAERNLHSKLFDPAVYNPRVIQDLWRKANRNDFANIRSFAEDKCTGYDPNTDDQAELGSMRVIDDFATENPYKNFENMRRNFTCSGGQTIHVRLDPDRTQIGFHIERNWDWLYIQYPGYYKQVTGYMTDLDNRFKQPDWVDLQTSWLQMQFTSDSSGRYSGFRFEIKCRDAGTTQRLFKSYTKSVPITNEVDKSRWTKEVECVNPHETVSYRLKTELVTDPDTFYSTINKVFEIKYNDVVETTDDWVKSNFNQTSGNWIDSNSNEIFATYNPSGLSADTSGSGDGGGDLYGGPDYGGPDYGGEPGGGSSNNVNEPPSNIVFNIETKCQVVGELPNFVAVNNSF